MHNMSFLHLSFTETTLPTSHIIHIYDIYITSIQLIILLITQCRLHQTYHLTGYFNDNFFSNYFTSKSLLNNKLKHTIKHVIAIPPRRNNKLVSDTAGVSLYSIIGSSTRTTSVVVLGKWVRT